MSEFVTEILPGDRRGLKQVDALLLQEGIRRDANLDYICGLLDEEGTMIATGSCFHSTLRCFAVSHAHRGEGLLNRILTHLIDVQAARGNFHLFLYTKPEAAGFFGDLGFHEIARVQGKIVFMENRRDGFPGYLRNLSSESPDGEGAAVVMNANPFTRGHQHLIEQAAANCGTLHLFLVSEDLSLVPYTIRRRLAAAGTAHLPNVRLHDCGPYLISSATFPSYFLRDAEDVIEGQARLDAEVFVKIARAAGIAARWAGEEPASQVTGIYNRILAEELPRQGIQFRIIPRLLSEEVPVSASTVRECLQRGDWETVRKLVPESTLEYLKSPEAVPVLEQIRNAETVRHY